MDMNIAALNYSDNGHVVTVVFGDGCYMTFYKATHDSKTWIDAQPYRGRRMAEA